MVVIMIGRNRNSDAWIVASMGLRWVPCAPPPRAKSIIMIAFFFTMPIKEDDAD